MYENVWLKWWIECSKHQRPMRKKNQQHHRKRWKQSKTKRHHLNQHRSSLRPSIQIHQLLKRKSLIHHQHRWLTKKKSNNHQQKRPKQRTMKNLWNLFHWNENPNTHWRCWSPVKDKKYWKVRHDCYHETMYWLIICRELEFLRRTVATTFKCDCLQCQLIPHLIKCRADILSSSF